MRLTDHIKHLQRFLVPVFCLLLVFAVYGNAISFPFFIFDDQSHIASNSHLNPVNLKTFLWIASESLIALPLTAWAVLSHFFGTANPAPFRTFNLIIHAVNGILVFQLLRRLLFRFLNTKDRRSIDFSALAGASIFLVHPANTEAVVWISALKDLLAACLGLVTLELWFRLQESPSHTVQRQLLYGWILVTLGLALFSKLSAGSIMLLIPWFFVFFQNPQDLRKLYAQYKHSLALWAVLTVAISWLFYGIYFYHANTPLLLYPTTWTQRLVIFLHSLLFNLNQLFIPRQYYFNYGHTPLHVLRLFADAPLLTSTTVVLLLLSLVALALLPFNPKYRRLHFVLGWIVICTLPTSGLIPFVHQNISTTADRFVYLATVAVGLVVAWLTVALHQLLARTYMVFAVTALLLILGTYTWQQKQLWMDSEFMIAFSIAQDPANSIAHEAMSVVLKQKHRIDTAFEHKMISEALRQDMVINLAPPEKQNSSPSPSPPPHELNRLISQPHPENQF